jgi:hypothetical protein
MEDGGWNDICSRRRSDSLILGPSHCPRTCFVLCTFEAWCFTAQSLPCPFDDISVYERFNLVLSALGFNEGFDVCLPIYNLISPLPWLQHQKQRFKCRP